MRRQNRWTLDSPTTKPNHPPTVVVNGHDGFEPLYITAHRGETITLDATESFDIDGDALKYGWFQYKEAEALLPVSPALSRLSLLALQFFAHAQLCFVLVGSIRGSYA